MSRPVTQEQERYFNEMICDQMMSASGSELIKVAETTGLNDAVRWEIREKEVFGDNVLPIRPVTKDMLYPRLDNDRPAVLIEVEPMSAGAVAVNYGDPTAGGGFMGARKLLAGSQRLQSRRIQIDVDLLSTWRMDLRRIMGDKLVLDLHDMIDEARFAAINRFLVGPGTSIQAVGFPLYQTLYGGISRDTIYESTNVMQNTPQNMTPKTGIISNVTATEFCKWTRNEVGGDWSQELLKRGKAALQGQPFFGIDNWIITLKKWLIPNWTVYYFGDPDALGREYEFQPCVMWGKKEGPFVSFYYYMNRSCVFVNPAAMVRVDIN